MEIEFDKKTHTYMINGEIATTSVTKLLAKHKLSNNYDGIDKAVLKRKANYGNNIHEDIENWVNDRNYQPKTEQCKSFIKYAKENIDSAVAEQKVGIEYADNLSICGSIDLIGFNKMQDLFIADHKTYASMTNETKQHIAWQLSIYDYMLRKTKVINDKKIRWTGAKHFYCFWYKKDGSMEIIELDKISDLEIEALFEAELNGEIYTPRELLIPKELELQIIEGELRIAQLELEQKEIKAQVEKNREQIKQLMEKQKITKWESPNGVIKISYVCGYQKSGIDNKKLKEEYPLAYSNCFKPSNVKSSIKVSCDTDKLKELEEIKNGLLDV